MARLVVSKTINLGSNPSSPASRKANKRGIASVERQTIKSTMLNYRNIAKHCKVVANYLNGQRLSRGVKSVRVRRECGSTPHGLGCKTPDKAVVGYL